ncbi:MAG: glutamate synthase subunit beta [Clostridia bacterium]|nr:glutamate synthase subunit beta [Clostridia bacterium]
MGKPTGFLEYNRELPKDRPPAERLKDWKEFHTHFDTASLKLQGARCMDCGIPFCHTGKIIDGSVMGCPINNLIPEWNDLVYRGKYEEAYRRLSLTNNFPEFTGRVCPALCEGSCTLGMHEPAVTIKNIEVHIIDKMFEENAIKPRKPKRSTGKCVAVVGSGPSGLACADQLNQAGHKVTVFERADRAGGLLMYGIPNMKLDKSVVERRIKLMEQEGVTFVLNTEVGKDYSAAKLVNDFDAVVLCCGSTVPRPLAVEGNNLNGVYFAMDFLKANTKSLLDSNLEDEKYISAKDKDVIVVGGGDTGTDCVGTAIRHGCKSVTQLEIMPELPVARTENNPWPQWPKIKKVDYGQEESIEVFGKDPREYCTTVTKIVGDDNGAVKEVHTVDVKWVKDSTGRVSPQPIEGSEKIRKADLVLIAMGFLGPEQELINQLSIETDARSNVAAVEGEYKTNIKSVFSAGDMRRGQSLVVWAIREGREAAREVDRFLMGETVLP